MVEFEIDDEAANIDIFILTNFFYTKNHKSFTLIDIKNLCDNVFHSCWATDNGDKETNMQTKTSQPHGQELISIYTQ